MLDVSRPRNEAKRSINQLKNLSKSLQDSIQNPFKIPPKPFSNRPKTLPKPTFKKSRVQNASLNPFLGPLERFLVDFGGAGPPQTEPKSKKTQKHANKTMFKKVIVSNTIFHRFLMVLASQNGTKMELFKMIFRKRRFCEN